MKKSVLGRIGRGAALAGVLLGGVSLGAFASDYKIDPAHSFVQFKIYHLGYSWLNGRFNTMEGGFVWDPKQPDSAKIDVMIETKSVDTNHAERDKHLRSDDFLNVSKFPSATFESVAYRGDDAGGPLDGELTLHGVTKPITIEVDVIAEGKDPWGGYRAGFAGEVTFKRSDFGMTYDLGPKSDEMQMELFIEGIRK